MEFSVTMNYPLRPFSLPSPSCERRSEDKEGVAEGGGYCVNPEHQNSVEFLLTHE